MTYPPTGPLGRRSLEGGRRRSRGRWWLVGGLVVVVGLLLLAGNGGRAWWARRLGDLTHGSRPADYLVGLAVGLLPVIAIGIAAVGPGRRRPLRLFAAGSLGFIATDLLAPSFVHAITHSGSAAARPFDTHVPMYLPGVYTGVGVMLLAVVVAVARRRRRARDRRYGTGRPAGAGRPRRYG